jgi:hypothetical protein
LHVEGDRIFETVVGPALTVEQVQERKECRVVMSTYSSI